MRDARALNYYSKEKAIVDEKAVVQKHKLTERQELFCIEYVLNGGIGAAAARRAGYAEVGDEQESYRLLRNAYVIARISELREQAHIKTGANVEWLQSMLVTAIERCLQKEEIFDSEGNSTGIYRFDSKGAAANASILMKLNGWDGKSIGERKEEQPVLIIAVENFTGWNAPGN